MDSLEKDIQKLLAGEVVGTDAVDLSYRPEASAAPNVEYVPVVKRTVCYIVMALVFDDQGRVVLIQEAKESCRGLWYIPAGRVEPGENFIDGVKREVLEEAGLEIEPFTVFSIETYGADWYRIGYLGRVTGGKLKSLEEQDSESLQAKWFTVDEILNGKLKLRHKDFFKTLRVAQQYMSQPEISRHPCYHIGIQPHQHLLLRPVLIKQTSQGNIEVLCKRKGGKTGLPCCRLHPKEFSLTTGLMCVYRDVFQLTQSDLRILLPVKGLLTVEHCGTPAREHDGICITPVFVVPNELHKKFESVPNQDYMWYKMTDTSIAEELTRRTFTENLLIPLIQ